MPAARAIAITLASYWPKASGCSHPGLLGERQQSASLQGQPADHGRRHRGGQRHVRMSRDLIVGKGPDPAKQRRGPAVADQRQVILAEHLGHELVVVGRGGVLGRLDDQAAGAEPLGSLLMDLARRRRLQLGEAGNRELRKQGMDTEPLTSLEAVHEHVAVLELGEHLRRVRASESSVAQRRR